MTPTASSVGNWYALAVVAGREQSVRKRILERLERDKIAIPGLELVCPDEEIIVENKQGEREKKRRLTLPGYLLLRARRIPPEAMVLIPRVKDVLSFLGPDGSPTALNAREIEQILGHTGQVQVEHKGPRFEQGEKVQIVDGPMSGFEGEVIEISESQGHATLEVEIFGRATRAEVSLASLRKS